MFEYLGAKCYAETIEEEAIQQIKNLVDSKYGFHERFMSDAHSGKGCVIGTTMLLNKKVNPDWVGVDLGCGVLAVQLEKNISVKEFDNFCNEHLVSGQRVHETPIIKKPLYCVENIIAPINKEYAYHSLGTLGGGNHFVELSVDTSGQQWLLIHTGSRHLGLEVANYYQKIAEQTILNNAVAAHTQQEIIAWLKKKNLFSHIEKILSLYKEKKRKMAALKKEPYLTGENLDKYLQDVKNAQIYAKLNRYKICYQILTYFGIRCKKIVESVHNYIDDFSQAILRKGAISAGKGEFCVIPMNMRDGTLLCKGKGCADWNWSAPHGAGRIMSRAAARKNISLEEFQSSMEGIASSTICEETIDEAPMAYKPMEEIVKIIEPTVEIIDVLKPIFNYKGVS